MDIEKNRKRKLWPLWSLISFSALMYIGVTLISKEIAIYLLAFVAFISSLSPAGSYFWKFWSEKINHGVHFGLFFFSMLFILVLAIVYLRGLRLIIRVKKPE